MSLEASFVLVVCGAAWISPPLGLLVGGLYLGLIQVMHWRAAQADGEAPPQEGPAE